MTKYRALYERYRALVVVGTYAAGERLPSLRSVAETEGLGLNTVRSAFELLEGEGLVEALERGGYYARHRSGAKLAPYVAPPACRNAEGLSASQKIQYLLAAGGAAAGFALAEPDSALLPIAKLERLYASLKGPWIEYGDQSGEEELRRRITAFYHPYHGDLESGDIVVTNGATEAIGIALRALVEPGDLVALESPTYYDYFRQLAAVRARIVEVPVAAGRGMDLDLLESRMRRAANRGSRGVKMIVVQPNVQNPTGTIMADADKSRLVELAASHGALILEDEVYGDLAFGRERPSNLSAFGDYDGIVSVSSFSKCLAPGLRIGWMAAPAHGEAIARAKSLTSLSTNRPAQAVLAAYLGGGSFRKQLAATRAALEGQLEEYLSLLSDSLPDGSSFARPEGGCLLWLALPKGVDASRVFEAAAREGILAAPGELFSANPYFRNHMRINFGHRLGERRREELSRLCAIAREAALGIH
jgi:DNA-binding transcriptional MocR family regulator